ncbi:cyclin-H [Lingula anatina]|uniref:Cyclin-H n=1 Tax=Lingula anatina TaxID=7574 RepID=A0A1S3J716_LINAN|nr:cyclin-H [Lingula anatina]|eukprot:XP_013406190.1 cyclin-H [Lingula anatina]
MTVGYSEENKDDGTSFLDLKEERILLRHYEYALKEFCARFQDSGPHENKVIGLPREVVGTAINYMKRFFLNKSVMDYHPKDIMLTCVYLSTKVEENHVSLRTFVSNIKGDPDKNADIVLCFELLLMKELHYHMTIHNPFRALEGLIIDVKTRCKAVQAMPTKDVEKLRKGAFDFIDRSLSTDACLIFAPSQIALAALLASASEQKINLDSYVTETLLMSESQEHVHKVIEQVKRIRYMVKHIEPISKEDVRNIHKKLMKCRNQENNPESEVYKRKMDELLEEEEEYQSQKRAKIAEEEKLAEKNLVGL